MKICFLLESCELSGGVRVVFDLANALRQQGHDTLIVSRRGSASWYPHPLPLCQADDFVQFCTEHQPDIVVATFWTTIAPAMHCPAKLRLHFCQGCEWECPEYGEISQRIIDAYRAPIPKITVGPWLERKIRDTCGTDQPIASIGQCVDTQLFSPAGPWQRLLKRIQPRRPTRVLVPGLFQASVKGIRFALAAVALLRQQGRAIHLVRVSAMPLSAEEAALTQIDAYHCAISAEEMCRSYRSADLVIVPSLEGEGFGLPFTEALACGIPAIATEISSFRSIASGLEITDFLVPPADSTLLADKMVELIDHPALAQSAVRRARQRLGQIYAADAVARRFAEVASQLAHHD